MISDQHIVCYVSTHFQSVTKECQCSLSWNHFVVRFKPNMIFYSSQNCIGRLPPTSGQFLEGTMQFIKEINELYGFCAKNEKEQDKEIQKQ